MASTNFKELQELSNEELYEVYVSRKDDRVTIINDFKLSCKVFNYFFVEIEKFERQHICKITARLASSYGFNRMIHAHKLSNLILESFKEFQINPWEMEKVPDEYWKSKENRQAFVLWIFDTKKLNYHNLEDVKEVYTYLEQRMPSMFQNTRKKTLTYKVIKEAIPNLKIERWELENVKKWEIDESIRAVKWLIENKLGFTSKEIFSWNDKDIKENIKIKYFLQNDLSVLLYKSNYSIVQLVRLAYKK